MVIIIISIILYKDLYSEIIFRNLQNDRLIRIQVGPLGPSGLLPHSGFQGLLRGS